MLWLEGLGPSKWIVRALLQGFGLRVGVALARSIDAICRDGLKSFFRNSLLRENESCRLIGIQGILAGVAAAMHLSWTPLFP